MKKSRSSKNKNPEVKNYATIKNKKLTLKGSQMRKNEHVVEG